MGQPEKYRITVEVTSSELKDTIEEVLEYLKWFGDVGASRSLVLAVMDSSAQHKADAREIKLDHPEDSKAPLYFDIDGDGVERFASDVKIEELPEEEELEVDYDAMDDEDEALDHASFKEIQESIRLRKEWFDKQYERLLRDPRTWMK